MDQIGRLDRGLLPRIALLRCFSSKILSQATLGSVYLVFDPDGVHHCGSRDRHPLQAIEGCPLELAGVGSPRACRVPEQWAGGS